ncbi:RidA family protein [Haloterrigena alkaliphila]|uniref:RidA family protein n=1 Tax=Haloterrigena alkaliphila TaxID=2816475 RepID=A0A8A2VHE2_9EURY|nr:RidA family protein [Haloterrigena alkaliphila]QSW99752.1 RidA family protein [Haloterrigena alkaliphila]
MDRQTVSSDTEWEPKVGYSRAVRAGSHVHVAGTTATDEDGSVVAPGDPYRQTERALEIVADALAEAGANLEDVVRTRIYTVDRNGSWSRRAIRRIHRADLQSTVYVTDIDDWEAIGRARGEVFGEIRPAASMVEVQRLIDPDHCVEIEAVAITDDGR